MDSSAELKQVRITADGSCLGNGTGATRAAVAAILRCGPHSRAVAGYIGSATNQQAEIAAAAFALEALKEPCAVTLRTDSRYVVETMSGRFKRKANHDWWARLDRAANTHEIEWQWIKGHAGQVAQEAVDKAARRIAALGRVDERVLREATEAVSSFAST